MSDQQMMKFLVLGLGLILGTAAHPQAPTDKALLWRISGPGITKPSYLFGTIHLLCPADINVTPAINSALGNSSTLFLEINLDDPAITTGMTGALFMTNDTTLEQLLPRHMFDSVSRRFLKMTGMALGLVSKIKPMLATALIYPSLLKCNPEGWETVFMKMAKEQHKKIQGLEDFMAQVSVIDKIPYRLQADMLAHTILNSDSTKNSFDQLLKLYRAEDLPALATMLEADKSMAGYGDLLLDNRNKNWLPVIDEQVKTGPGFFAVGAAHLAGNKGLISLLRKQGYSVEPIFR